MELQKLKGRCKGLFRRTACLLASAALILPLLIPAVPAAGSGGTFLGGNHTISGVSITGDGSHQGLFRYLQPGGQIKNLTVRGTVAPGGSAEQVGGIVGRNQGTLSLCTFVGMVKGSADVGGVVGVNEATGRVTGCTASAAVSGKLAELTEELGPVMDCLAQASGGGRELADDLGRAVKSLQTSVRQAGTALDQLRRSAGDVSDMSAALQSVFRQLGDLSDDAGQTAGLLSSATDKLRDAVDGLRRAGPITLTPADDAYRAAGDRLFDDLNGASKALKELNGSVSNASDTLLADLRAINRQFNVLVELVLDALLDLQDGVEDGERVQDTSEENADGQTQGKVDQCVNSGAVEGDRNVGGILGSMAIEYTLNPEDDGTLNLSLGATYEAKSVVLSCVNQGVVTGKKDCVGGVVGRMDLGFLSACQNYGDVESTGGSYVGGVAGCGGTVRGCAAICLISNGAECLGAVAGCADELDAITENYYIDTGLGGVDGVSYAGHSQSAGLEFLRALEGVPAEFTAFRLILRADGHVLQTIPFAFGQRLSRIELPAPPEKEGFLGVWPAPEDDTPRSDVILDKAPERQIRTQMKTGAAPKNGAAPLLSDHFVGQVILRIPEALVEVPGGVL